MLDLSVILKGDIANYHVYGSEQTYTFLSPQAIVSIMSIIACCVALFVSWRAYQQSARSTGPDMELVKRVVESAPLERLAALQKPPSDKESNIKDD